MAGVGGFLAEERERGEAAFRAAIGEAGGEELLGTIGVIVTLSFPPGSVAAGYHAALMQALIEEMSGRGLG